MLKWALLFLVVAVVLAGLGFSGLAGAAVSIAKFLAIAALIIFAVLFVLSFKAAKGFSDSLRGR